MNKRQAIQNAYLELSATKPLSEIKIKDITDLAQVSRTTYYKYYYEPKEILDDILQTFIDILLNHLNNITTVDSTFVTGRNEQLRQLDMHYTTQFFGYFYERKSVVLAIQKSEENSALFWNELTAMLNKYFHEKYSLLSMEPDIIRYISKSASAFFLSIIREWIDDDFKYTPVEMTYYYFRSWKFMSNFYTYD